MNAHNYGLKSICIEVNSLMYSDVTIFLSLLFLAIAYFYGYTTYIIYVIHNISSLNEKIEPNELVPRKDRSDKVF